MSLTPSTGDAKYEVFGAFTIDVVNDTSFIYNQYIDMDEDTYNRYVDQVISRSDVDSGIRPSYGEQLLTLSTCEYSSANGRYVVVARRVSDPKFPKVKFASRTLDSFAKCAKCSFACRLHLLFFRECAMLINAR